jgi:hypothetical protein
VALPPNDSRCRPPSRLRYEVRIPTPGRGTGAAASSSWRCSRVKFPSRNRSTMDLFRSAKAFSLHSEFARLGSVGESLHHLSGGVEWALTALATKQIRRPSVPQSIPPRPEVSWSIDPGTAGAWGQRVLVMTSDGSCLRRDQAATVESFTKCGKWIQAATVDRWLHGLCANLAFAAWV